MEKKYTITDKQLIFLDGFLIRKGYVDAETKHELMDHLICDFEENGNGNLSQYLADNLYFIERKKVKKEKILYTFYLKNVFKEFINFFIDLKKTYLTLLLFMFFYLFSNLLTPKVLLIVFTVNIVLLQLYIVKLTFVKKELRKIEEFRALSSISLFPTSFVYCWILIEYLIPHKFIFIVFWLLLVTLLLSVIGYIKSKRKELLEKYKHLLN